MSDLLEAVKKGSLDYIDSMTDTTDSISSLKDPTPFVNGTIQK